MKHFVTIFAALFIFSSMASAQTIDRTIEQFNQTKNVTVTTRDTQWNTRYTMLLEDQNSLLKQRKTAIIMSLAGSVVGGLGSAIVTTSAENGESSPVGTVMAITGGACTLAGGVWLLMNEFQLINSQKAINNHLRLRYSPTGVVLEF